MSCCNIKGCINSVRSKKYQQKPLSLHRFPKDMVLRQQWISASGMDENNLKNKRICNAHFQEEEFSFEHGKRTLNSGSVPSVDIPGNLPKADFYVELPISPHGGKNKYFFLVSLGNKKYIKIASNDTETATPFPKVFQAKNEEADSKKEIIIKTRPSNVMQIAKLRKKVKALQQIVKSSRDAKARKNRFLKIQSIDNVRRLKELREKNKSLEKYMVNIKTQINRKIKEVSQTSVECFTNIFSPAQMNIIQNTQKKAMWSVPDIAKAIGLRAKSPRAYNYLREVWKIPLPAQSTLLNYMQSIDFNPGILNSVMNLLKHEFEGALDMKRQAVLSFDEMSIDSDFCYDHKNDKIYGGESNLTLAIIRGLFFYWKQPIFYNYSQITPEEIFKIIVECYQVGIHVISMVCDLGGKNRGLWNTLGVSIHKPYILHPVTPKKIWVFADAPHLLKLLRNHILDQGMSLSPKGNLNKEDFMKLIRIQDSDFKMQHKVSEYHVNLRGRERQRVLPACQLLSNRTYEALSKAFPSREDDWKFIKQVNDWFDIMNSRNHKEKNPYKAAYVIHLTEQNKKLNSMYTKIMNSRVNGKDYLEPFQKGFLMSIKSLQGLFADLQSSKMPVKYILTHRLNQDVLENAFSVIRSIGCYNDSPRAEDAKNRIKILMLGWNFGKTKSSPVETNQPKVPFISYKLLSTLFSNKTASNQQEVGLCFSNSNFENINIEESITGLNWTEKVNSMSRKDQCEFYGMEYVSGFIAHKLKEKFPQLQLTQNPNRKPESFTQSISRGFLSIPSYKLLNYVMKFEKVFLYMFRENGDRFGLYRGANCMKSLTSQLLKLFPELPEKLVKLYVRTRVFIRVKRVNQIMKISKFKSKKKSKSMHWLRSSVPSTSVFINSSSYLEAESSTNDYSTAQNKDVFAEDDAFFEGIDLGPNGLDIEV